VEQYGWATAANPEPGLIHVLDRRHGHLISHGFGNALERLGGILS